MNYRTVLISILFLAAIPLFSQDERTLTLEECLTLARKENLSLLQDEIYLNQSRRNARNSWSYFLPSLSAAASSTYVSEPSEGTDQPQVSGSVTASLNLTSSLPLVIRSQILAYKKQEISYEEALLNLDCLVEQSFYELIAQENSLAIQKDHLDLAGKEYELIMADFLNGRISEISVFQSQVSYENLRPSYNQARINYNNNLRTFLNTLGLELNTPVKLDGDLRINLMGELNPDELINTYLYARSDVQKSLHDLKLQKNEHLLRLSNKRLPKISLSAGWNTIDLLDEEAMEEEEWTGAGSLTFTINVPLDNYIPGSQDDLSLRASRDSSDIEEIQFEETLRQGELQIYNLVETINSLEEALSVSKLRVEVAEINYEMNEEGFQKGVIDQFDMEDARINLLNAQQDYLGTQLNYRMTVINLMKALNITNIIPLTTDK